jgi:hypothetical protein
MPAWSMGPQEADRGQRWGQESCPPKVQRPALWSCWSLGRYPENRLLIQWLGTHVASDAQGDGRGSSEPIQSFPVVASDL